MKLHIGWTLNILLTIALCAFIWNEYPKIEMGCSPEHRAELQNKINQIVPLSIADLGEYAE